MKRYAIIFFTSMLIPLLSIYDVKGEQQIFPCSKENAYKVIEENDFSLLICSFGSPPEKKKDGWWNANGISFHKVPKAKGKTKQEFIAQFDEFGDAIDFNYKDKTVSIISYANTLPGFKLKPFIKETIALSGTDTKRAYSILLEARRYTAEDMSAALALLNMSESNYRAQYQEKHGNYPLSEALYKLRDYAIQDPQFVSKELGFLRSKWWCDGEMAENLSEIENEVHALSMIRSKLRQGALDLHREAK
jgi:hypothetical protein